MTSSPSSQDSSSIDLEHSQITHEEDPDAQQIMLNQVQRSAEPLRQFDAKFDSTYVCYNYWLILMIIIAGSFLAQTVAAVVVAFFQMMIDHGISSGFFICLLSIALHVAFLAQFALEKRAISTRNLTTATLALKIITFFSVLSLVLTAHAGYDLYDYDSKNKTEDSKDENADFFTTLRTFVLIVVSFFSGTQIFITHFQAIKVRNDLIKREKIKAGLQDPIDLLPISVLYSV